jgi:hypothetical protein
MTSEGPTSPEERLERGEVLHYPVAPFPLFEGHERDFLLRQREGGLGHKNISFDPATGRITGLLLTEGGQEERLRGLFEAFSRRVTDWLRSTFQRYAGGLAPDRASFRPAEEATRRARLTARNDLLHVDSFPNRPARGRRILRAFANVSPSEPRVWATSEPFARLLERYGEEVGLPGRAVPAWLRGLRASVAQAFRPGLVRRSPSDDFMLRFHDFLKLHDDFQERGPKRLWAFPPGSAWLAMTDACTHAELRGRFALEHSYFVEPQCLALPDRAPAALLEAARARRGRAA